MEQGKSPEEYVEGLRAKAAEKVETQFNCGGQGTCSYLVERAMRDNLGDERPITMLPTDRIGRNPFEVAASLHSDGYGLKIDDVPIKKATAEELEGKTLEQIVDKIIHEMAVASKHDSDMLYFRQGDRVLNQMSEGEVTYLSFFVEIDGKESNHAVGVMKAKGKFFFFDQVAAFQTEGEYGGGVAILEFSDEIRTASGGALEINLLKPLRSIRIVD